MLTDPTALVDGDVTEDLFAGQDAAGKRALCESLNKDAKKKQSAALQGALAQAAAEIIRTRLVVVHSPVAAKAYMNSCSLNGLRARVVYADFTQFAPIQSKGAWTKVLCKQPSKDARLPRAFVRVWFQEEEQSRGPHVAMSPLRAPTLAQRYPPTPAPTNRPTKHSE